MAKFCKNCGATLEEGKICDCQSQQQYTPTQGQYQGQPQYGTPITPAQPSAAGVYFKRMLNLIMGLIKAPATVGSQFVNSCDFKLAFGLIGVQTLAIALFLISLAGKINSAMSSVAGGFVPDGAKFPLITIFLIGGIVSYGMACLLPAVLLMFTKMFKRSTTYKYMLCASGVNSIMVTPFVLVGVLLSLVMPLSISASSITNPMSIVAPFIWPLAISLVGIALGNFTTIKILSAGSNLDSDKAVYVMFLTVVVLYIAFGIIYNFVFPMCLPPLVKSAMDAAGGIGNLFS